jgi:hypothetical protein
MQHHHYPHHTGVRPLASMLMAMALLLGAGPALAKEVLIETTLPADRPIPPCPVAQQLSRNGQAPDPEVLRRIVRCNKGERPAVRGFDGAVTVEISALEIGKPRQWSFSEDAGDGKRQTLVYPVRVSYSVRTFYRSGTHVSSPERRQMYFHVNAAGQWQSGAEGRLSSPA